MGVQNQINQLNGYDMEGMDEEEDEDYVEQN